MSWIIIPGIILQKLSSSIARSGKTSLKNKILMVISCGQSSQEKKWKDEKNGYSISLIIWKKLAFSVGSV